MDLPGRLALGLTANCKFKSEEALEIFVLLPRSQSRTAWVQCQVAKANFELVRYEAAATHFKEARRLDRFRLEDLQVYSTVLWHMKRETELMYLAHELMAVEKVLAPVLVRAGQLLLAPEGARHRSAMSSTGPSSSTRGSRTPTPFAAMRTLQTRTLRAPCAATGMQLGSIHGIGQIYFKQEKLEMTE